MPKHLQTLLFCICCLISISIVWAEEIPSTNPPEPVHKESFSQSKWETLRKKIKIKGSKPTPQEEEKKSSEKKDPSWELDPTAMLVGKWSLFTLLTLLLLFLVLNTLGINPFQKKKNGLTMRLEVEALSEHLDEADLDPFLIEAIKNGNYKLAIRLYYLQIVQRLHFAGKIRWKRFKTNKHYLNEMLPQADYQTFKELTIVYEKCWFGPDIITQNHYDQVCPAFINYAKNLPAFE